MTEKQKYYLWFALIVSICMTILMEIFQLYTLPVLGILGAFHARECMHDHSEFIYS